MKTKEEHIEDFKKQTFTVSITCSHCGAPIHGVIEDGEFDWHGMADWASGSELFEDWLPDFNRILCGTCTSEKVSRNWKELKE